MIFLIGLNMQIGTQTASQSKCVVVVAKSLNKTAQKLLKLVTLTYKAHDDCVILWVKPRDKHFGRNLFDLYKLIEEHLNKLQTKEKAVFEISNSFDLEQVIEKFQGLPNDAFKALFENTKIEIP